MARKHVQPKPLSPMQQMTISNLRRSQEGAIPVSLFTEAKAGRLLSIAAASKQSESPMTVTTLAACLLVDALMEHPPMRRGLVDGEAVVDHEDVHLAIAVAKDDGSLVTPVIHDASLMTVEQLTRAVREAVVKARGGNLELSDVRGGTFTLSSTGSVPVAVHGTPLLNSGQSGILLVGAAAERAVVDENGEVRSDPILPLSLTIDHAAVNGVPALHFLADLVERIEDPAAAIPTMEE